MTDILVALAEGIEIKFEDDESNLITIKDESFRADQEIELRHEKNELTVPLNRFLTFAKWTRERHDDLPAADRAGIRAPFSVFRKLKEYPELADFRDKYKMAIKMFTSLYTLLTDTSKALSDRLLPFSQSRATIQPELLGIVRERVAITAIDDFGAFFDTFAAQLPAVIDAIKPAEARPIRAVLEHGALVDPLDSLAVATTIELTRPAAATAAAEVDPEVDRRAAHIGYPIIVVPPVCQTDLSILNANRILATDKFEAVTSMEGITRNERDLVAKLVPGFSRRVKFEIVSDPQNLRLEDWQDRVVAVFALGKKWQFKKCIEPYREPSTLFNHVAGFHVTTDENNIDMSVRQWNVTIMQFQQSTRNGDQAVMREFWRSIGNALADKPHYRSKFKFSGKVV